MSPPPLLILNPAAAGGRSGRRWPELEARIRKGGLSFEVAFSTHRGHATELARAAVRAQRPMVVAVGGDGTMNEVVNGFFDSRGRIESPTRFGILPLGTGGDFRRSASVPADLERAAEALAAGETMPLDLGRATFETAAGPTSRHFLNIADAGIGGEVTRLVAEGPRLPRGSWTYLLASLRALYGWRNVRLRIEVDGREQEQVCQQVVIANGQYYGGGMRVAPGADWADGLLDVIVIGDVNLVENMRGLRRIRSGTHLDGLSPKISHQRARRVEVRSAGRVLIDLDGEQPGYLPASFEVVPAAIELVGCQPEVSPSLRA
ncbi:MAG TPA: diacylglycerol kinase family protein [Candidatus Nitrosotalea sp.]|nr:diacylglycerol kinase family protein [Candidatus Nitrosotalea sp.]